MRVFYQPWDQPVPQGFSKAHMDNLVLLFYALQVLNSAMSYSQIINIYYSTIQKSMDIASHLTKKVFVFCLEITIFDF